MPKPPMKNKEEDAPKAHMVQRADGGIVLTRVALLDEFCDQAQMQLTAMKNLVQSSLENDPEKRMLLLLDALRGMEELGGWLEAKRAESTLIQNASEIAKESEGP